MVFYTKNSTYFLDTKNHTISGGSLKTERKYVGTPRIIKGEPAVIKLADGQILKTSVVL